MRLRYFLAGMAVALSLVSVLAPSARAATGAVSPEAAVERYHAVLLEAMKDAKALGIDGRYDLIVQPAWDTFDFSGMAARVTGKAWREAGEDERSSMAQAFGHMSVATYAKRFQGWSGQAFETLGTEPGPKGLTLVKTQIADPGHEAVALTYVMEKDAGGGWRIIDILLKGTVSELAVKKSEYASVLKAKGLGGLAQALNSQADKLLGR
jgi:phospholipid transport system substrate-binding protein